MKLVLQIAAGILLAGLVTFWLSSMMVAGAVRQAEKEMAVAARNMRAQSEAIQAQAEARRAEANARRARELEQRNAVLRMQAEAQAYRSAMEKAWIQEYREPRECEHPANDRVYVECRNRYMRARREFEARWQAATPHGESATVDVPPGPATSRRVN